MSPWPEGSNVNRVQHLSGARVDCEKDKTTVVIVGLPDAVRRARALVEEVRPVQSESCILSKRSGSASYGLRLTWLLQIGLKQGLKTIGVVGVGRDGGAHIPDAPAPVPAAAATASKRQHTTQHAHEVPPPQQQHWHNVPVKEEQQPPAAAVGAPAVVPQQQAPPPAASVGGRKFSGRIVDSMKQEEEEAVAAAVKLQQPQQPPLSPLPDDTMDMDTGEKDEAGGVVKIARRLTLSRHTLSTPYENSLWSFIMLSDLSRVLVLASSRLTLSRRTVSARLYEHSLGRSFTL